MKTNQRIKLILDLIKNRAKAKPDEEVFQIRYEELEELPLLKNRVVIDQLLKKIQEESKCLTFILPKIPDYLIGKEIITAEERNAIFRELNKSNNSVELSEETLNSFSIITVYIENVEEFNRYYEKVRQQLKGKTVPIIFLNDKGGLYMLNDKGKRRLYPMKRDGLRYKMVYCLAKEKRWLQPEELAKECEMEYKKVGKTIEQIRRLIEKFLKIKGDEVIESGKGIGYRIKKIRIKES